MGRVKTRNPMAFRSGIAAGNFDIGLLHFVPNSRVLDVGAGDGWLSVELAKNHIDVHSLEPDAHHYSQQWKLFRQNDSSSVAFPVSAKGENLPYPDSVFDGAICCEVLEHVADPQTLLRELHRVLRPGARLGVAVPTAGTERFFQLLNPQWLKDCTHVQMFTRKMMLDGLGEAGFCPYAWHGGNCFYTYFWFFHNIVRTQSDGRGHPLEHERLTKALIRFWKWITARRIGRRIETIGNSLLPKSLYIYCERL